MSKTHITDFEQLFSQGILERAEELADDNHISGIQMKKNATIIEAVVDDGSSHEIQIKHEGGFFTELQCDCEFDFGPCKHLAAFLIYLTNEFVDKGWMDQEDGGDLSELRPLLEEADKEDLIRLITFLGDMHADIRQFIADYIQSGGFEMQGDISFEEFEQEISEIDTMLNQLILTLEQLLDEEDFETFTVLVGDVLSEAEFGHMRDADISGDLKAFPDELFDTLERAAEQPAFGEEEHAFLWGHIMEQLEEGRIDDEIIAVKTWRFLAEHTADNTQLARYKTALDKVSGKGTLFSGSIDDEQYDRLLSIAREGKSKEDE